MSDIEKVIGALKMDNALMEFDPNTGEEKPIESQNEFNQYMYKANLLAISALEKQIAEKIEKDIVIDEDYSGNTYEREIPVCPSCNYIYLTLKQSYCNQCGQKLDWRVEE